MRADLWDAVDRLVDRSPSMADLQSHGLQLLAADRWRRLGRAVPADVAVEELWAAAKTAATDEILARVRAACEGRLLVLKGPEVAAHYPTRTLRPSADLDILAEDATETQAALVAAGFERVGAFDDDYYEGLHHLRPLRLPDHPVPVIEIHR